MDMKALESIIAAAVAKAVAEQPKTAVIPAPSTLETDPETAVRKSLGTLTNPNDRVTFALICAAALENLKTGYKDNKGHQRFSAAVPKWLIFRDMQDNVTERYTAITDRLVASGHIKAAGKAFIPMCLSVDRQTVRSSSSDEHRSDIKRAADALLTATAPIAQPVIRRRARKVA